MTSEARSSGAIATDSQDDGIQWAKELSGRRLALSRNVGDRRGMALALINLGNVSSQQQDCEQAKNCRMNLGFVLLLEVTSNGERPSSGRLRFCYENGAQG